MIMAPSGRQGKGQACTIAFAMLNIFFLQAFLNRDGKIAEGILSRLEMATVSFLSRLFSASFWSVSGDLKLILMNPHSLRRFLEEHLERYSFSQVVAAHTSLIPTLCLC